MDSIFESQEFERGFLGMLDKMDPERRERFLNDIEQRLNEWEEASSSTPVAP